MMNSPHMMKLGTVAYICISNSLKTKETKYKKIGMEGSVQREETRVNKSRDREDKN